MHIYNLLIVYMFYSSARVCTKEAVHIVIFNDFLSFPKKYENGKARARNAYVDQPFEMRSFLFENEHIT